MAILKKKKRAIYGQAKRLARKTATQTARKLTLAELISKETERIGELPLSLADGIMRKIKITKRGIAKNNKESWVDEKDIRMADTQKRLLDSKLAGLMKEYNDCTTHAIKTWAQTSPPSLPRKPCTKAQVAALIKLSPFLQRGYMTSECVDTAVFGDDTKPCSIAPGGIVNAQQKEKVVSAAVVCEMSEIVEFERDINDVDIHITLDSDICTGCGGELVRAEGHVVCEKCGLCSIDRNGIGDVNQLFENTVYIGNKCVYDIKKDFQRTVHGIGGGDIDITPEILQAVNTRLLSLKMDPTRVTQKTMQSVLRGLERMEKKKPLGDTSERLHFVRVYKAIPYLLAKLCGQETLLFTDTQIQHLYMMFDEFQEVYIKLCPGGNMINKRYLVYKFCELSGWVDVLRHIKMVKAVTLKKYDESVWRDVCAELGWKFNRCSYI